MKPSVGKRIVGRLKDFTEALEKGVPLAEKYTCRKVSLKLNPTRYTPRSVRGTRELLGASQALFARFLGVSVNAVQAWEQGVNAPNDMACRFMDEIRHDPPYWRHRLQELAAPNVAI